MRGTKPSLATCATFCESLTPSNRRTATYMALAYLLHIEGGPRRPCRLDQRAQCERLQGLAQLLRTPSWRSSRRGSRRQSGKSERDRGKRTEQTDSLTLRSMAVDGLTG